MTSGCSMTDKAGVTHHVILGFGVVSVARSNSVVQVEQTRVLGLDLSNGGSAFGVVNRVTTYVDPGADVGVEVEEVGGKLRLNVYDVRKIVDGGFVEPRPEPVRLLK